MSLSSFVNRVKFFMGRKRLEKNFSSRDYWEMRYKSHWNSGQGSYGDSAKYKAQVFNQILKDYEVQSVIEFGCGDGHQLKFYEIPQYLGLDVSKTIIAKVSEIYKDDSTKSFKHYIPEKFDTSDPAFKAEMAISVDVIFHLVEDPIFGIYMRHLFASANKCVAIYATDHDEPQVVPHLRSRNFTKWVARNIEGWALKETRPVVSDSGEEFLSWYIYTK